MAYAKFHEAGDEYDGAACNLVNEMELTPNAATIKDGDFGRIIHEGVPVREGLKMAMVQADANRNPKTKRDFEQMDAYERKKYTTKFMKGSTGGKSNLSTLNSKLGALATQCRRRGKGNFFFFFEHFIV